MLKLMQERGVQQFIGHMCRHGMVSKDELGEGPVLKPTGWLTNAPCIAEELGKRCLNDAKGSEERRHRHVLLLNGKAKGAAQYPIQLCTAILRGQRRQMQHDGVEEHDRPRHSLLRRVERCLVETRR